MKPVFHLINSDVLSGADAEAVFFKIIDFAVNFGKVFAVIVSEFYRMIPQKNVSCKHAEHNKKNFPVEHENSCSVNCYSKKNYNHFKPKP